MHSMSGRTIGGRPGEVRLGKLPNRGNGVVRIMSNPGYSAKARFPRAI